MPTTKQTRRYDAIVDGRSRDREGSRTSRRRPRHLPERRIDHSADRRRAAGSQRRMGAPAPLHPDQGHGRAHTAVGRHRANSAFHRSRIIQGHLSHTSITTTSTDVSAEGAALCPRGQVPVRRSGNAVREAARLLTARVRAGQEAVQPRPARPGTGRLDRGAPLFRPYRPGQATRPSDAWVRSKRMGPAQPARPPPPCRPPHVW